jgi:hypothetical protein
VVMEALTKIRKDLSEAANNIAAPATKGSKS